MPRDFHALFGLLRDVLPTDTAHNLTHRRRSDAEQVTNGIVHHPHLRIGSDGANIVLGHFSIGTRRTAQPSPLRLHIVHVVLLGSEEEMGGIHAPGIIAARAVMEHKQTVRNRAVVQLPGIARGNNMAIDAASGYCEPAIPRHTERCRPQPAGVRSAAAINLLPEAFIRRALLVRGAARDRAVRAATAKDVTGDKTKGFAAVRADTRDASIGPTHLSLLHRLSGVMASVRSDHRAGAFRCLNYTKLLGVAPKIGTWRIA
jgi:hypothetical protein